MAGPEVGIGLAGYGMMGKAHSYAYTVAPVMRSLPYRPRLRAISGRDKEKVSLAAAAYGFETWTDDWQELVRRPDVDIVDICTPPGTHAEIATCVGSSHALDLNYALRASWSSNSTISGRMASPATRSRAIVTGSLKRRGPALPGLR